MSVHVGRCALADGSVAVVAKVDGTVRRVDCQSLADVLFADDPLTASERTTGEPLEEKSLRMLAPVDRQDVWAAGVTYKRSKVARMEESEKAASHYDQVYDADRPELFFKSTASRVVGPDEPVRVRADSEWTVPEPELTLAITPDSRIVGYTVGNDMSARDIEGENPLYLPQAKTYRQSCALGPWVWLHGGALPTSEIKLSIRRGGKVVNEDATSTDQIHRKLEDLVSWLFRDNEFPHGAFLLTGTGIIPPDDFSLEDGDEVTIEIEGIGTLTNPVVKGVGE